MKYFTLCLLAMCGTGCTVIKYVKTEKNLTTNVETKTEFSHISPIFVKRDVKELDLLQGKMSGFAGSLDPQTAELMSAATEGAVRGGIKAAKP